MDSSFSILSQHAIWGGECIAMPILDLRLVETLEPRGRICLTEGVDWDIGVKSPELILDIV